MEEDGEDVIAALRALWRGVGLLDCWFLGDTFPGDTVGEMTGAGEFFGGMDGVAASQPASANRGLGRASSGKPSEPERLVGDNIR